jgi:diguanylate cyclase (GGDEF)-like protein/PAS domain S-box-containing protein
MTERNDVVNRLRLGSAVAGACVALVGFVALVGGWWLDISALRQPISGYSAMRAGTALALILSGTGVVAAGLRWPRWVTGATGLLVGALGATVITGYVLDLPKMGFEAVFALHPSLDEIIPGRIAINTGACFVMAGAGLILLALRRADGFRQALGVGVFLIPYTAIMGYVMASVTVSGQLLPEYTAMAPTTAAPMLLVGIGLLLVSVERGWGRIFAEPGLGGRVIRIYLPITLALFLAAAAGFARLQQVSGSGGQVGAVVLAIVAIAVVGGVMVLASWIGRTETELALLSTEAEVRSQLEQAQRIAHVGSWTLDLATNHLTWSEELFLMQGLDPASPVPDLPDTEHLLTPASWQQLNTAIAAAAETGDPYERELESVRPDGSHGWMLVRGEAVRDAAGAIVGLQGVTMDITDRKAAQEALAASAKALRLVLNTSPDSVIRIDRDGRIRYVNAQVERISGIGREQWIGRTFTEMGYVDFARSWDAYDRQVFDTGEPLSFEFELDNAEGHRWYETSVSPEVDAAGTVIAVVQTSRDITQRKESEISLRAIGEQLEQAQRIAHVGSWTLDLATGAVTRSKEMHLMQGTNPVAPELDYAESGRLFTPESWLRFTTATSRAQETGAPFELELEMVRPDGSHGWMLARGEAQPDAEGAIVGFGGVALDITDAKAASGELLAMATHDGLTGLANRSAMLDEINRALSAGSRAGRSTAVLMLDLDRFKNVNDTLGHGTGDQLLQAAADRITGIVRAGELVARLGGDEFVVVMRDLEDPAEAVRAAWRLVEAFRRSFTLVGAELYATASIGVAIATDTSDPGDLIREADSAMYAAKDAGRDRVSVFNEDLRAAANLRMSVEVDLRHALERGELAVWYQPEVELATGAVIAVEALLRWHHPDGSVWTADRFVDVAEDTGLILDVGDWVLRQACTQAATWAASRPDRPITVRVNASALQLAETGLLPAIDAALAATGLDPTLLCIEITETALLRQTTTASENLNGIRERRIAIAIDDFGTGFASLTYLRRYPVDILKIDQSFIIGITNDDHDRQITAGIIALARALNITVTAEGVEHPDQAALLRQMGCPGAQGWLYSKALPPEDIIPVLDHTYPHD